MNTHRNIAPSIFAALICFGAASFSSAQGAETATAVGSPTAPDASAPAPKTGAANADEKVVSGLKKPGEAAHDILALIQFERADTAFISTTNHPGILADLSTLESAANAMIKDDGKDAEATQNLANALAAAINLNISRVNSTFNRPNETAENKAKCRQMQLDLTAIRVSFQPVPPAGAVTVSKADSKMVPPKDAAAAPKAETTTTRLEAAQAELNKALASLEKSNPNNHGGFIEKARTDAGQAITDLSAAQAYLKEHPEQDPLTPGTPPTDKQKFSPAAVPSFEILPTGAKRSPNIDNAIDDLNAALLIFMDTPKGQPSVLVLLGDLDGNRDKIMADINQANADILAALNFAHARNGGAAPAASAPAATAPAKP